VNEKEPSAQAPLQATQLHLDMLARVSACACSGRHAKVVAMKNIFSLLVFALIACSAVSAQQVTDFRKPGDVIRLEIKFEGQDASKIKRVSAAFNIPSGATPVNQNGFGASFGGDAAVETAPHTYVVEAKVPNSAATGDYFAYINVQAEDGGTQYIAGQQFQLHPFHVKNDRSFVPPTITVTELR